VQQWAARASTVNAPLGVHTVCSAQCASKIRLHLCAELYGNLSPYFWRIVHTVCSAHSLLRPNAHRGQLLHLLAPSASHSAGSSSQSKVGPPGRPLAPGHTHAAARHFLPETMVGLLAGGRRAATSGATGWARGGGGLSPAADRLIRAEPPRARQTSRSGREAARRRHLPCCAAQLGPPVRAGRP